MMPSIDQDKVSALIIEAAETIILPRYRQLDLSEIFTKTSPNDLVTVADREAEAFLDLHLPALCPGSILVGEESISEGTKSLDMLGIRDQLIWVADPVDGTYNFVHGKREFAVMLACIYNGTVTHGWIYDVLGGKMMVAEKGAGASFGGVPMKTATPKPLSQMQGFAGHKYFPKTLRPYLVNFESSVGSARTLGCAAHEYLNLASGQADFSVYSRVKPWDHLAGTLAVTEAGGCCRLWSGQDYYPAFSGHGLYAASSKEALEAVRESLIHKLD